VAWQVLKGGLAFQEPTITIGASIVYEEGEDLEEVREHDKKGMMMMRRRRMIMVVVVVVALLMMVMITVGASIVYEEGEDLEEVKDPARKGMMMMMMMMMMLMMMAVTLPVKTGPTNTDPPFALSCQDFGHLLGKVLVDLPGGGIRDQTTLEVADYAQSLTVHMQVYHR
jgi:predicted nucleic acid-binding Zn ribbon protein